jgi:peptide/nickel transport system substrate-binding protein
MYYDWDFWKKPVGNGPYKFVRNVPKTMVEVEANPEYFGPAPKIKKAILKFSSEPALQELISGNVDVLTYVPRDFLFKIEGDDRFTSYHWWGSWVEAILWNHNNTLFEEPLIRKALTMAINREELVKVLNYPDDVPITDVLSTRGQRQRSELPEALKFDPQKAKQILAGSGWEDTDNDGILDKNGADFSFTITARKENNLMATYIQNNMSNIGVNMEIESIEANIIRQRLNKNEFEAILQPFPNREDAIARIRNYFDENSTIGYENRKLDSLFQLIENTGDKKEIDRLYRQLIPIFQEDLPVTLLVPQVQTHIVRSDLKGLSNLYRADPVNFLEFLWFEN